MVNLAALTRALPRSALEPQVLGILGGFIGSADPEHRHGRPVITLLEPPAGQCEPCLDAARALTTLLRHQGHMPTHVQTGTRVIMMRMRLDLAPERWVRYFDRHNPDPPECLPASEFVRWLRASPLDFPAHLLDFLERAAKVVASAPLFDPDDESRVVPMNRVSLHDLAAEPRPKDLFTYFHAPWCDAEDEPPGWDADFMTWRETMRPIAQTLEQALGRRLYHFDDHEVVPDDPMEEDHIDLAHRFFVLHWCCTHRPESGFVRHLVRASGAEHVDALKAALMAPGSYTQAFELDACHVSHRSTYAWLIEYLPPTRHKTLVMVFLTADARDVAQMLLPRYIGADVRFVAPPSLVTQAWMRRAARNCRSWQCWSPERGWLERPVELLAAADEVCVIANDDKFAYHLNLCEAAEDLLWLAIELQANHAYYSTDGWALSNPDQALKKRGVPERGATRQAERAAFTQHLSEIRLSVGFGSSGLEDERGGKLSYEQLDLPLALLRRVFAWQRDLVEAASPACPHRDRWQQALEHEQIEIARALRAVRDWKVFFKPPRRQVWLDVDGLGPVADDPSG